MTQRPTTKQTKKGSVKLGGQDAIRYVMYRKHRERDIRHWGKRKKKKEVEQEKVAREGKKVGGHIR